MCITVAKSVSNLRKIDKFKDSNDYLKIYCCDLYVAIHINIIINYVRSFQFIKCSFSAVVTIGSVSDIKRLSSISRQLAIDHHREEGVPCMCQLSNDNLCIRKMIFGFFFA